jgi:SNF2 family DNA or RNA helicase
MPDLRDLLDNTTGRTLADALRILLQSDQTLSGPELSVATAYFNLDAFEKLADELRTLSGTRLLLGQEVDREFFLNKRLLDELRARSARGDPSLPSAIQAFVDWLSRSSVHLRIYRKGFLHAKAYLIEKRASPELRNAGIVGSSNFTGSGLTQNLELNAVLRQDASVTDLKAWFERVWQDSEEADEEGKNYKQTLINLLSRFVALYSPYEVYIKVIYEASRAWLEREQAGDQEGLPSPIALADFQRDGYLSAKEIIEKHRGVLLADSVGLGKTFLALRLLDDYAYHLRQTALIICPAQQRDLIWKPWLQRHAIPYEIISMETFQQADFDVDRCATRHRVIVVDESHNFRNDERNRWKNLHRLMTAPGAEDRIIILLTATPINNSVFDLYHQVRFITRDRRDFLTAAGIPDLLNYFKTAEKQPDALYEVLEALAVRRSRSFITRNYPNAKIDGQDIRFPHREVASIPYSLEHTYEGVYKKTATLIENLNLAPYRIEYFRKDIYNARKTMFETVLEWLQRESGLSKEEAGTRILTLGRQSALAHIMQVLFLKRLESSVEALRLSLRSQLAFQEKFLECLNSGLLLNATAYRKWVSLLAEEDLSAEPDSDSPTGIVAFLQREGGAHLNIADYETTAIRSAVENDVKSLKEALSQLDAITPDKDDKLRQLVAKLRELNPGKTKIIVFTYFKDTAEYIYRNLTRDATFTSLLSPEQVALLTGASDPETRNSIIKRFAPDSNGVSPGDPLRAQPVQLLISTDVISEGQNLQEGQVVINYDLHWNPVRMIQRIGRIDRLGSPHHKVYAFNFHPEDALDHLLKLMQRLREKLETINRSIGLDASTLGEAPDPKDFNAIRRIVKNEPGVVEQLEEQSELAIGDFLKQDLSQFIRELGKEALEEMPIGISLGSAMRARDRAGFFAAFHYKPLDVHFWLFLGDNDELIERRLDAIRQIRCGRSEPTLEPDLRTASNALRKMRSILANRLRQAGHKPPTIHHPQNIILQWLQAFKRDAPHLLGYFSRPLTDTALKDLRSLYRKKWHQPGIPISARLRLLQEFAESHPHPPLPAEPPPREVTEDDFDLIGWVQLIGSPSAEEHKK